MKKLCLYFILIVSTIYTTIIYNSTAGVLLLGVEIILPLMLWFMLFTHIMGIRTEFKMNNRIIDQNSCVDVLVKMKNNSFVPILNMKFKISIQNKTKKTSQIILKTMAMDSKSSGLENLMLEQQQSGIVSIKLKNIYLYDIMNLFYFRQKGRWQEELIVLPRRLMTNIMVRGGFLSINGEGDRYHDSQAGDDRSYVLDFREYQPGDRLQSIHWKASLKKESLLVKIPGKPLGGGLYFVLEQAQPTESFWEIIYSVGFSLCEQQFYFTYLWHSKLADELVTADVFSEEELYLAMEQVMRHEVADKEVEDPDTLKVSIRLDKELKLYYKEQLVAEFAEKDLEQNLLEMELIL
jgi:hypothetical protein